MRWTLYFKDVITSFDDFIDMLDETSSHIDTSEQATNYEFLNYCYIKIRNKYNNSNIRYTEKESFMVDFSNIFEDVFFKFKEDFESINKIYALKTNDLKVLQETINNVSLNPNRKVEDVKEALDYFGGQQATFNKINDLQAEITKLESTRSLGLERFLNAFRKLFIVVIPQNIPYYN